MSGCGHGMPVSGRDRLMLRFSNFMLPCHDDDDDDDGCDDMFGGAATVAALLGMPMKELLSLSLSFCSKMHRWLLQLQPFLVIQSKRNLIKQKSISSSTHAPERA